jgi:threonine dehydrogenase-like Zn-dependent dehydrogenase
MADKNNGISRRSFLKGAAVVSVAATGALAGCAPRTTGAAAPAAAGTAAPAAGAGAPAAAAGANASGIITSSPTVAAVMSADSDLFKWRIKPEEPTKFAAEDSADVVIVGAGIAGLNAARAAATDGAKVIVVEKKDKYDVHGFQCATVNSQMVKDAGLEIDAMAYFRDYIKNQQLRVNQDLISMWVHKSGEAFDFYETVMPPKGNDWKTDYRAVLYAPRPANWQETVDTEMWHAYIGTIDFSYESWAYAGKCLYDKCVEMGVKFVFDTAGYMLTQDSTGKVTGVITKGAKDATIINKYNAAKGVILACGNFATNPDLCNDLCIGDIMWAVRNGGNVKYNGLAANNGEGHQMVVWAGGNVEPWERSSSSAFTLFEALPGLSINQNGKRWRNEDVVIWSGGTMLRNQPKMYYWECFDANWEDLIDVTSINHRAMDNGNTFWSLIPEGYNTLPDGSKTDGKRRLQDYLKADILAGVDNPEGCKFGDYVFMADKVFAASTLEKLADMMGFDEYAKKNFLAEVEAYNAACDAGVDDRFGKRANLMKPMKTAPFIATGAGTAFSPAVGDEGVRVDGTSLAVTRKDNDRPIGGLWAAGGLVGGREGLCYLPPMCGHNHGWCVTTGYVAGHSAAKG